MKIVQIFVFVALPYVHSLLFSAFFSHLDFALPAVWNSGVTSPGQSVQVCLAQCQVLQTRQLGLSDFPKVMGNWEQDYFPWAGLLSLCTL